MFGYAAFSQSPFATLGVSDYKFFVFESVNSADSSSQLSTFIQALVENSAVDNVDSTGSLFFFSLNESLDLSEVLLIGTAFSEGVVEGTAVGDLVSISHGQYETVIESLLSVSDTISGIKVFTDSVVEASGISDSNTVDYAFVFSVVERITSDAGDTTQSDFLQSLLENLSMQDAFSTTHWYKIFDAQDAGWVPVNDSQ